MLCAFISDIHSNWEALDAVLAVIDTMAVDALYCLGDIVGYNADPQACLETVLARSRRVIRGNHDKAVACLMDLRWFNRVARDSALWTRKNLSPEALEALKGLPQGPLAAEEGILLCHGTPYDEDAYLLDEDTIDECFSFLERMHPDSMYCFCGHTHHPLVAVRGADGGAAQVMSGGGQVELRQGEVCLINPGSVGQPRDGIPRASFGILDTQRRIYRNLRVAYDFAVTQRKILTAGLPPELARRLAEGR
jgi:diadenosine tetraphosphatase ApaH/serine/threonine PP2A family protein phosphatase